MGMNYRVYTFKSCTFNYGDENCCVGDRLIWLFHDNYLVL